jgi:hypothetical protein
VVEQTPQQTEQQPVAEKPVTWPYTDKPLPAPIGAAVNAVGMRWGHLRNYLMRTLPSAVINNSSNVVGLEQLVAEGMLFKSNGFLLWDPANKGKWHYVIDPVINVPKAAFEKISFKDFSFSKFGKTAANFFDRERAALADSAGGTKMLTNNMSALSGLTGMSAMAVAAGLPDRKDTPEETERMSTMAHENPLGYAGLRVYQAINPLAWWNNKRQFSGFGMIGAGTFSFLSAFRQIDGEALGKQMYRTPNWWHAAGSAITTTAGVQLLLAINNQQGWSNYGTTQLLRTSTLPMSIKTRFDKGFSGKAENGAPWYLGGQALMVVKNMTASLIGGGHRTKEGEVIKGDEMRATARQHIREKSPRHDDAQPSTMLTEVGERAPMQERQAVLSA